MKFFLNHPLKYFIYKYNKIFFFDKILEQMLLFRL
jgi:hypothetical protein